MPKRPTRSCVGLSSFAGQQPQPLLPSALLQPQPQPQSEHNSKITRRRIQLLLHPQPIVSTSFPFAGLSSALTLP